jgi:hypothetical protein
MAKNKRSADQLADVARNIGTTLGDAVAKANRVVKGVKAAAQAGKDAYSRGVNKSARARPARKKRTAKKSSGARG